ncbi:Na+/H+ antiporter subunit E [Kaistia sp. 32K]|uniref:Na+/H+ antiporter subunit E n=1 Tax=Kaistia sp. 32K TaxID=2795690 RepID=UPI0019156CB4|nr:Na+/H+ antiporter subunit E [Kaistia sp. 32K]BCP54818.1 Na+/H+ antiporter subunit E [Kaistia sp. 32K]
MVDSNRRKTGAPQGLLSLWVVLFVVWMAANSTLAIEVAILGAVITYALAYAFTKSSDGWQRIHWTPSGFYHFLAYTGTFLVELVKANVAMMKIVYSPRIDIKPGIVRVRTKLKSPIGRLALANTIALTPGSLVIDVKDEILYIHWLDVQSTDVEVASAAMAGPFEDHLEKVFG